jgi:hypothetical protein
MAITVTTDLVDISNCDTTTTNGTFYRLNGPSASNPIAEPDARRQGVACMGYKSGTALTPTDTGGHFNFTTTFDVTGQHVFHWRNSVTAGNTNTKANRGLAFGLTNTSTTSTTAWSTTNYKLWLLDGSDTDLQGGWVPYAVDPSGTADVSAGTLTLTTVKNCAFISRQQTAVNTNLNNILVDAIRRGTGVTATCNSALDTITLESIYSVDSTVTNAWGIVNKYNNIYYPIGTIRIGATNQTNTCLFKDTDDVIVWRQLPVSSTLYNFVLNGAVGFLTTFQLGEKSGTVTSNGVTISRTGTAVWNITCNANTRALLYASTLTGLNTCTLTSTSEVLDCTFNSSGTITTNGATITSCGFTNHTATQLLIQSTSEMSVVTLCTFTSSGTGHAIEIKQPGTYSFSNLNFSGYGADGTTNAAIFNNSGGAVTINVSGGTVPTFRNGTGASTTVTAAADVTLTGLKADSEIRAYVGTNPATATEIAGIENSGTSFTFTQSVAGSQGYIQIFHVEYQPVFLELTYSGSNTSIPIQQIFDRQYDRGTTFSPS